MNINLASAVTCALVLLGSVVHADEDTDQALSKIVQLGPGVHAVKRDSKGRIQSCVVVGQSRISTVLGAAKGKETARQRARLAASGEFVKWLKEKVSVHARSEDETIMFLEGSDGNDQDALKESGKAVEKTSTMMESISEGLVRGLQVLHAETNAAGETYSIVMGWSADQSEATKKIGQDQRNDQPAANEAAVESGTASAPAPRRKNKTIRDEKVTSDDVKKFLP